MSNIHTHSTSSTSANAHILASVVIKTDNERLSLLLTIGETIKEYDLGIVKGSKEYLREAIRLCAPPRSWTYHLKPSRVYSAEGVERLQNLWLQIDKDTQKLLYYTLGWGDECWVFHKEAQSDLRDLLATGDATPQYGQEENSASDEAKLRLELQKRVLSKDRGSNCIAVVVLSLVAHTNLFTNERVGTPWRLQKKYATNYGELNKQMSSNLRLSSHLYILYRQYYEESPNGACVYEGWDQFKGVTARALKECGIDIEVIDGGFWHFDKNSKKLYIPSMTDDLQIWLKCYIQRAGVNNKSVSLSVRAFFLPYWLLVQDEIDMEMLCGSRALNPEIWRYSDYQVTNPDEPLPMEQSMFELFHNLQTLIKQAQAIQEGKSQFREKVFTRALGVVNAVIAAYSGSATWVKNLESALATGPSKA
ncbi:hypothetical protein BZG36_05666 [Bifiguratus adelaidae]|uniref:Uncharacterized protein n=1 Tax=Bifiguratus adelaidae TaxID=1938954 RepID=A0A261XT67_9FUNG|nr:hypothetical protein BZG36_05666 [Bifiguratus adelaidae]